MVSQLAIWGQVNDPTSLIMYKTNAEVIEHSSGCGFAHSRHFTHVHTLLGDELSLQKWVIWDTPWTRNLYLTHQASHPAIFQWIIEQIKRIPIRRCNNLIDKLQLVDASVSSSSLPYTLGIRFWQTSRASLHKRCKHWHVHKESTTLCCGV